MGCHCDAHVNIYKDFFNLIELDLIGKAKRHFMLTIFTDTGWHFCEISYLRRSYESLEPVICLQES